MLTMGLVFVIGCRLGWEWGWRWFQAQKHVFLLRCKDLHPTLRGRVYLWVESLRLPGPKGLCTITRHSCGRRRSSKMYQAWQGKGTYHLEDPVFYQKPGWGKRKVPHWGSLVRSTKQTLIRFKFMHRVWAFVGRNNPEQRDHTLHSVSGDQVPRGKVKWTSPSHPAQEAAKHILGPI